MNPNSYDELAEIIRQIDAPERILSRELSKDYQGLMLFVDELLEVDPESINKTVDRLLQDPARGYTSFVDRKPYISIALSFAYDKKGDKVLTQKYAQDAKWQFGRSKSEWNKAISQWYLGIVYRNNGEAGKERAELNTATKTFSRILNNLNSDLSKGRSEYQLAILCTTHIDSINRALVSLQEYRTDVRFADQITVSYNIFSSIIGKLKPPEDKLHEEWLHAVSDLDLTDITHIQQQISILDRMLMAPEGTERVSSPFAQIFLAHCENLIDCALQHYDQSPEIRLQEVITILSDQQDHYNRALATWYLGLIHARKQAYTLAFSYLTEAANLLNILLTEQLPTQISDEVQNMRIDLQSWITPLRKQTLLAEKEEQGSKVTKAKPEKKSLFRLAGIGRTPEDMQPDPTPYRKNESNIPQFGLKNPGGVQKSEGTKRTTEEQNVSKSDNKAKPIQHIVIPVDIQALRELNADLIPLEADLYKSLQEFGEKRVGKSLKTTLEQDSRSIGSNQRLKRIPSFPIYGQAAAGPNGEPNWDSQELDKADIVYDDLCAIFAGQQHNVKFLVNTEYKFLGWRRYGWLQVLGESMNISSPIPIKHGSFVLFVENRNIESCFAKIVVAALPQHESEPTRLIVKRLLKLSTQLTSQDDGYTTEYATFVLHSESSYEKDPKTGKSFDDIVIKRDGQIIGEVIAVAIT